jgi:GT2 family glycosyltransferase
MTSAVVIPNWNGAGMLGACLDALVEQTSTPAVVVVVDNGSHDDSVALARSHSCQPVVLELTRNTGFTGAVNAGLAWCISRGHESVALLNNDAQPEPSWLSELEDELSKHPRAAAVASTMLVKDAEASILNSTGEMISAWGLPYARGYLEPDRGQYANCRDVAAASGGASLFRVAALQDIGLFYEPYFAYFEDVDLSLRARLRGWEIRYCPSARVVHQVGGTSSRVPGFREFHTLRNGVVLPLRVFPLPMLVRTTPRLMASFLRSSIGLARKGEAALVIRAWGSVVRLLPGLLVERRRIQRSATLPKGGWRTWITPGRPPNTPLGGHAP